MMHGGKMVVFGGEDIGATPSGYTQYGCSSGCTHSARPSDVGKAADGFSIFTTCGAACKALNHPFFGLGGDGEADLQGKAVAEGFGPVVVDVASPCFVWLLADAGGQPVLLRPDSTYVWDLVTGVAHASCNQALGASRARAVRVPPGAAGGQGGVGEGLLLV